ncbi:glucuronoxylan 4-O-methyltransferase 1-like [Tripterygium wilfordii]|uniref:Glucuronoxylan 4-O-methyltransferase 1-like n=1 Tax=Tripterygium wilfordii TaxID=458696 RepID=A0A7J7CP19_TRIWF|nr:probable methyltransferase At1g27930 [Tripterygium wilfordii]KAF5735825.1 glucuronoxylan 4-O-methyltransferase 1-like [Tripterygium wilfordii]
MKNRSYATRTPYTDKPWLRAVLIGSTFAATILLVTFHQRNPSNRRSLLCSDEDGIAATATHLQTIVHYATSRTVPQQSKAEISVSFAVLQAIAPCNFLVFGLGHDSLMWASLNPRGTTVFLEEDPKWVHGILQNAPSLRVHTIDYHTRLSDADYLLSTYKSNKDCAASNVSLKVNTRCKLALSELPDSMYDTEWDVIMIDGPRGYFPETSGRMTAIYTAAVMARARTQPGVTHVFLHDVNRKVEKVYAEEFLCRKYLVKAIGRLWHFEIPPTDVSRRDGNFTFC